MNCKFNINEKVKYLDMIGIIIDWEIFDSGKYIYLVKYEDGSELWAFEDSLKLLGDKENG